MNNYDLLNNESNQLYLYLKINEIVDTSTLQIDNSSFDYLNLMCEEINLVTNSTSNINAIRTDDSSSNSVNDANSSCSGIHNPQAVFTCKNCCCILGLPANFQSTADMNNLLEPIKDGIVNIIFMVEDASTFAVERLVYGGDEVTRQRKSMALIELADAGSLRDALNLYSNINFPSSSSINTIVPPCFTVEIRQIEVTFAGKWSLTEASTDGLYSTLCQLKQSIGDEAVPVRSAQSDALLLTSNLKYDHPKADSTRRIYPTCTFCMRRVKNIQSVFGRAANDLLISKSIRYTGWETRIMNSQHTENPSCRNVHCLVCYLHSKYDTVELQSSDTHPVSIHYHYNAYQFNNETDNNNDQQVADGNSSAVIGGTRITKSPLGRCMDCDKTENIWMCMICCYSGCGRYSLQHAERHYRRSGHQLSLDLASGCIWDYAKDCFAHIEDPASLTHRGGPRRQLSNFERHSHSFNIAGIAGSGQPSVEELQGASERKSDSHFTNGDGNRNSSTVLKPYYPSSSSSSSSMSMYLGFANTNEDDKPLDGPTAEKMNQLVGEYDALLRSQLMDQQLYFEKLLAKESVRALEMAYQLKNQQKKSSNAAASEVGMGEPDLNINDERLHHDLLEVEKVKMEISYLESEYQQILNAIRTVDAEVRVLKKSNDDAVVSIKAHKQQEAEWIQREASVRQETAEMVAELENQARDLEFYTRTQKQMEFSPLKEEILGGVVVTKQSEPSPSLEGPKKPPYNHSSGKKSSRRK